MVSMGQQLTGLHETSRRVMGKNDNYNIYKNTPLDGIRAGPHSAIYQSAQSSGVLRTSSQFRRFYANTHINVRSLVFPSNSRFSIEQHSKDRWTKRNWKKYIVVATHKDVLNSFLNIQTISNKRKSTNFLEFKTKENSRHFNWKIIMRVFVNRIYTLFQPCLWVM